jgi:hypothetical protein
MRAVFNRSILPGIQSGALRLHRIYHKEAPENANLPKGSFSDSYTIHLQDWTKIGRVHVYVLPNGDYAYGGLDPKELVINETLYTLDGT